MTDTPAATAVGPSADDDGNPLHSGSMKVRHLVVFVIGAASPLTVLVGFAPLGLGAAGASFPLAYLVPGLIYLLFAVGYTAMSRHLRGSGAFYAYISEGFTRTVGAGAALLAYVGYLGGQIGFVLACGVFLSATVGSIAGLTPPIYVCALIISVVVAIIAYRKVDFGARILLVLMALELGTLAVFCVAVLAHGGHEGISLAGITFGSVFSSGVAGAFLLTFTSFVGFEQTAVYSDECVEPAKTISRATYIAVAALTFIYTFCAWVIVQAIGISRIGDVLSGDPSALVFTLNSEFAGTTMTEVMRLLIVTSFFAGCLALHNVCTRYLFAMGRTGVVPSVLGRVSPTTMTPSVAGVVQCLLVSGVLLAFAFTPTDAYTQVVVWTTSPTILTVLVLQVLTSVAVVRFFRRNDYGESRWNRVVAPTVSAIVLAMVAVVLVANMGQLTGLRTAGNALIFVPLVVAAGVGLTRGFILTRTHRRRRSGDQRPRHRPMPT